MKGCLKSNFDLFSLARYCPDPPLPPDNGGKYDWDPKSNGTTRYNTKVTYTCDVARKFKNLTALDNNNTLDLYDTQVKWTDSFFNKGCP